MQLQRGLRLLGLGAYAGPGATNGAAAVGRVLRPRALLVGSRPRPGLRLRLAPRPWPLRGAAASAASGDLSPASARTMEHPGAGERGLRSGPGEETGAGGHASRSAPGFWEGSCWRSQRGERDPSPAPKSLFPS